MIQACRGSEQQPVVDVPDDEPIDIADIIRKVPVDANLLIAYASTPGIIDNLKGCPVLDRIESTKRNCIR